MRCPPIKSLRPPPLSFSRCNNASPSGSATGKDRNSKRENLCVSEIVRCVRGTEWQGSRDATDGPSSSSQCVCVCVGSRMFAGVAGARTDDGGVSQERLLTPFFSQENGTFGIQ